MHSLCTSGFLNGITLSHTMAIWYVVYVGATPKPEADVSICVHRIFANSVIVHI